jgi:hypothetical protein
MLALPHQMYCELKFGTHTSLLDSSTCAGGASTAEGFSVFVSTSAAMTPSFPSVTSVSFAASLSAVCCVQETKFQSQLLEVHQLGYMSVM